jgi:hypothetical protein
LKYLGIVLPYLSSVKRRVKVEAADGNLPQQDFLMNDIRSLRCVRLLGGNGTPGCQKCQSLATQRPLIKCIVPDSHYGASLRDGFPI